MTWVSIEDRLPEYGDILLGASCGYVFGWHVVVYMNTINGPKWISSYKDGNPVEQNIFYWIKIPPLPGFEK